MRFVYTKNSEDFKSVNSKTKGEMLQNSTISLLLPSISNFFLTLAYSYLGFPSQGSWMYMVSSCISKVLWCYFLASQTVAISFFKKLACRLFEVNKCTWNADNSLKVKWSQFPPIQREFFFVARPKLMFLM